MIFLVVGAVFGQMVSNETLSEKALQIFSEGKYSEAEQDFRNLTKADPSNIFAHFYLGQTFFKEEKYVEAAGAFEKARSLQKNAKVLSLDQRRILIDQLVMAYGISRQFKKAHALLDEAIPRDPEYPVNYYNLACAFAEEGNKEKMLVNLALAFKHKDHMLKGEQMPDPRSDSSFQNYVKDDDFVKLMKELGYP